VRFLGVELIARKAFNSDIPEIARIALESYNFSSFEEALITIEREASTNNFLVAVQNNKVVGFCSWRVVGLPKHGLAEIDRIAVFKSHRGKGIASRLFMQLINEIKSFYESHDSSLRKLFLLTHANNDVAQRLYKKFGFKIESRLKNHYYNGVDELVFSRFF
jgi:ribosomal protein S18 acetylase RimI-like enzyme